MAHGGTIFLDEIGELPQHVQVKLLRVLQERVIQRLGSEEPLRINVRVMAATNRDLHEEMKAEEFRRDLYYRLSVVTLDVPPLRQHPEDIPKLAERYLADFRVRFSSDVSSFSEEAMRALDRYPWPGNIRELINVVERSVLLCEGTQITLDDLPRTIVPAPRHAGTDGRHPRWTCYLTAIGIRVTGKTYATRSSVRANRPTSSIILERRKATSKKRPAVPVSIRDRCTIS